MVKRSIRFGQLRHGGPLWSFPDGRSAWGSRRGLVTASADCTARVYNVGSLKSPVCGTRGGRLFWVLLAPDESTAVYEIAGVGEMWGIRKPISISTPVHEEGGGWESDRYWRGTPPIDELGVVSPFLAASCLGLQGKLGTSWGVRLFLVTIQRGTHKKGPC